MTPTSPSPTPSPGSARCTVGALAYSPRCADVGSSTFAYVSERNPANHLPAAALSCSDAVAAGFVYGCASVGLKVKEDGDRMLYPGCVFARTRRAAPASFRTTHAFIYFFLPVALSLSPGRTKKFSLKRNTISTLALSPPLARGDSLTCGKGGRPKSGTHRGTR